MRIRQQCRRAMTVVEVLVALIIFSVAALGSGAFIAASARAQVRAGAKREALDVLQAKASSFDAMQCSALTSGSASVGGIVVSWTVAPIDSFARLTLVARHRGTAATLRTEVVCQ